MPCLCLLFLCKSRLSYICVNLEFTHLAAKTMVYAVFKADGGEKRGEKKGRNTNSINKQNF